MRCTKNLKMSTAFVATALALTGGCATVSIPELSSSEHSRDTGKSLALSGSSGESIRAQVVAEFDHPWAMTFLPDNQALVTEKSGTLWLLDSNGSKAGKITNSPSVIAQGQGGLGDIIIHPGFGGEGIGKATVYLSYVERDEDDSDLSGAAVERAVLTLTESGGELTERRIIWRQQPKVSGNGHYSHRLAIGPGGFLYVTLGDRQKFSPAQNMASNLGKIVRLDQNGRPPESNPFYGNGAISNQIWSLGHRNVLGIDFDARGQLWAHEMGPKGGDELNRIVRSENYGYPLVSNGSHYTGTAIPSHASNPSYENPALWWDPVISPSGFVIYRGTKFKEWTGDGLIGGLSSKALIRVSFEQAQTDNQGAPPSDKSTETVAKELARYSWGKRIREVEQRSDGSIFVLEDGEGGRLVLLTPG